MIFKNSIIVFSFIFHAVWASASAPTILSSYVLESASQSQAKKIAADYEIVRRSGNGFEVLVPQNRQAAFLQIAPDARLISSDSSALAKKMFSLSRRMMSGAPAYHSFTEVMSILKSTAAAHSEITKLENYGKSQKGNALMVLRLSTRFNDSPARPRILLTAATHGDEIITTEVLLSLMNDMITQSSSNPRFARILDQVEVDFIPVVNPDGFTTQDRYDNNVDPNRSYPYPGHASSKPTASIAAEMKYVEAHPMVGSIDFHAYSGLVMYPWGYTQSPLDSASKQKFEPLTAQMAATNNYGHGQISDILYIAVGSSVDFYFWKYKSISLGIELGESKAPPPHEFAKYIQEQQESTWLFLESFLK